MIRNFGQLVELIEGRLVDREASLTVDAVEESVGVSSPTCVEAATVTFTWGAEDSLSVSIGRVTHYDIYSKDAEVLSTEVEFVLDAVLNARIQEQIWRDGVQPVASTLTFLPSGQKVHWRGTSLRRGAHRELIKFLPYPARRSI